MGKYAIFMRQDVNAIWNIEVCYKPTLKGKLVCIHSRVRIQSRDIAYRKACELIEEHRRSAATIEHSQNLKDTP